ncbi:MAG TPA: hypothetical protein VLL75_14320 [Vicinamibacteria bacterium]|nr:hypothetical protein [Vicinamibacteria bacterium]
MRNLARLAWLAAAALALPHATGAHAPGDVPRASVAPALSGRYKFVLTVSGGCPASMQVGPLTVVVNVAEASVIPGTEVSGQSASPSEGPGDGRFVLLRQFDRVHGAFGSSTLELGLVTAEGYLLWLRLMTDGTTTTSPGGRAQASGTAFGEVDLGLASDPARDSINCKHVLDHRWTLEPT